MDPHENIKTLLIITNKLIHNKKAGFLIQFAHFELEWSFALNLEDVKCSLT